MNNKKKILYKKSMEIHRYPKPGKIEIKLKKKINNKKDLSLVYSPGVAHICEEIIKNKKNAYKYTSKGNLVGVITNGTAVLGLGNIGALEAKPVMEGKSILFKKFANIDSYDIEIKEDNPKKFIKIVKSLEPTFGGINLEDIKSPECFRIEKECNKKMKIPVFHDDQHGTAVVVLAALKNALKINKKKINKIKTVCVGAGAAAIACLNLLVKEGMNIKNIYVFDIKGILNKKRKDICKEKKRYIRKENITIEEALEEADFLLGLSAGKTVKKKDIKKMNKNPIIFSLANPIPEITPEEIKEERNDAIIATGRSDYPNQVNNILCFPYIFRAALDTKEKIDETMKISTSNSISKIGRENKEFGAKRIVPNIFEEGLIRKIPLNIAKELKKIGRIKKFSIEKYKEFLKKILD